MFSGVAQEPDTGSPKPIFTRTTVPAVVAADAVSANGYDSDVEQPNRGHPLGVAAARRLARTGSVDVEPRLTDDARDRAERRFGIEFPEGPRAYLPPGLPVGQGWPDWRDGDADEITHRLRRP